MLLSSYLQVSKGGKEVILEREAIFPVKLYMKKKADNFVVAYQYSTTQYELPCEFVRVI